MIIGIGNLAALRGECLCDNGCETWSSSLCGRVFGNHAAEEQYCGFVNSSWSRLIAAILEPMLALTGLSINWSCRLVAG